jgi:glycosyltransferase involved in cell wall biosynthesis
VRITFILNRAGDKPIGGFKVVYEYANGLVRRGHTVTVVHAPPHLHGDMSFAGSVKRGLKFIGRNMGIFKDFSPKGWFSMDPRVRVIWLPGLHPKWIPAADAVVATAWQTAEWVADYPREKGEKFYFIHDYEYYMSADTSTKSRIGATYRRGMNNIVTSPAAMNMVQECGAGYEAYIPNGMDFGVYRLKNDFDAGARTTIGFPTRTESFKGTEDAICALNIVRDDVRDSLDVWSFGGKKPGYMPDWVRYYERPTDSELRRLYNSTRIFVVPSHYEGWGLPGSEAMACGAALVSTDNGGVRAYANMRKLHCCPPMAPQLLAANIKRLLADNNFALWQEDISIKQFTGAGGCFMKLYREVLSFFILLIHQVLNKGISVLLKTVVSEREFRIPERKHATTRMLLQKCAEESVVISMMMFASWAD